MKALNLLRRIDQRAFSAELTAAAWIDTRPTARLAALSWAHVRAVQWIPAVEAAAAVVANFLSNTATAGLAAGSVTALFGCRIAAKSHYVLNEDEQPCPYCPATDDGDMPGGQRLVHGGPVDIPPAPAPMPDIDDRIREWADDLTTRLERLLADTHLADRNGDRR